jgi:cytosine/adenosine deaminase-related metal-dependent hydrolase
VDSDPVLTLGTVFTGARLITCNQQLEVLEETDLRIEGDQITGIGRELAKPGDSIVSARGLWITPGFIQTHTHLVQTLFRDLADDLPLLDWLRTRIWPFEAAHTPQSTYASARLGITELLSGGTTAILDMASVHHTSEIFKAASEAGIRLWCGKAQMDRPNEAGLSEDFESSMQSACSLAEHWHQKTPLLHYAFAPRFVPSCTDALLIAVREEARKRGCLIHTHSSENLDEVELVRAITGTDNVIHLDRLGLSGPDVALAHCIHLTPEEEDLLARTQTRLLHCPGSNFKLASGLARIPELLKKGVHISLGADGAPCNNRLDIFAELRLAALMQKPRLGATALPAADVLKMATQKGAEVLQLAAGQLAVGKKADLVLLDPKKLWTGGDPRSALVYTMDPRCVRETWVAGCCCYRDGEVPGWSSEETARLCKEGLDEVRNS